MNCPRCNAENADHARFCANCGQPLTPQTATLPPIPATPAQPLAPSASPSLATTATSADPNIAFVLELVLGLIGFMGIGWMYGGQITVGVILLVGWWIAMAVGIGGLTLVTFGVGCCLWIPVQLIAPFISAFILRQQLQQQNPFRSTFPK